MSDDRSAGRKEAIAELRRIRAVESAPDPEGIRTVWHQGVKGTELVSWVNLEGRVVRQDFTLLEDHFSWTSQAGLRTGSASGEGGSKAGPASGMVRLDPAIVAERVIRAAEAVDPYEGEDRYLLHLRRTLELTVRGLSETGESTVTTRWDANLASAAGGTPARRGSGQTVALLIAGALLLGGIAVWLFTR